jgi:hypothetical protein
MGQVYALYCATLPKLHRPRLPSLFLQLSISHSFQQYTKGTRYQTCKVRIVINLPCRADLASRADVLRLGTQRQCALISQRVVPKPSNLSNFLEVWHRLLNIYFWAPVNIILRVSHSSSPRSRIDAHLAMAAMVRNTPELL